MITVGTKVDVVTLSFDTTICLPYGVFDRLSQEKTQFKQWVSVRFNGWEYVGRPVPWPSDEIIVHDFLKRPSDGGSKEAVAIIMYLEKMKTLGSVVTDVPDGGLLVGSPLMPGAVCRLPDGRSVRILDTTSPEEFGLATASTAFTVPPRRAAPPLIVSRAGSLERAYEELYHLTEHHKKAVLCGVRGVGKSHVCERVAAAKQLGFVSIEAGDFHARIGDVGTNNCLLYVRDADELCPDRTLFPDRRAELVKFTRSLGKLTDSIVVLGVRDRKAVDSWYMSDWLDNTIYINYPDGAERSAIVKQLLPECRQYGLVGNKTAGFLFEDLVRLANVLRHRDTGSPAVLSASIDKIARTVQAQFKADVDRTVTWDTLGGLSHIRRHLLDIIEDPLRYAKEFAEHKIPPPRGLLLHGPPGCSKTSVAKAIANATGLPFYTLDTAAIFSCYVGESERIIRELFAAARLTRPSIIFLDEIEVIVGKRGGGSGAASERRDVVQERLLSTFLTEMDGVEREGESSEGVLVIGATNRPDMIDSALLRPGRFDHIVELPLPDREDRLDILTKMLSGTGVDGELDRVAERTDGFSPAELRSLVNTVCSQHGLAPTTDHFLQCIQHMQSTRVKSLFDK